MKQIKINEIENIKIGNAENKEAGTGCTVIICEKGAVTGLDVRGGGPASRESELLKPTAASGFINAILLSGGSAFGLDAAGGVMEYLEEKNVGFDVGITKVPLVAQSCIFDLTVGDMKVRPDKSMAYEACVNAEKNNPTMGNVGAGTGATVGKLGGMATAMKGGLGSYAVQIGDLKVGAIVAVNACGDIYDYDTHEIIAGLLTPDLKNFANTEQVIYNMCEAAMATAGNGLENKEMQNTTIGVIITNGKFTKAQMNKIATMAHNGYARTINPVHTSMDGDSIYAMSVGEVTADMDMVGTLAANVMGHAVCDAIRKAEDAYGVMSAKTFLNK
ncbi:MAG: P1 family peptidase [Lachnospiraceae bacterium]|nr:P1 family peptidase [Lachnospiraceae bacterium]